ncbi:phage tail sheath family protein [Pollutibacter soli]|uniref:phage tail sheath family protein n=1 Tax=Pollutibacter soli TaxID=3034157 RepID=UPI003013CED6
MSNEYKTPGVYVQEVNPLPMSVVAVETALPVFVGYTEKWKKNDISLIGEPIRISSFIEFEEIFGGACQHRFTIDLPVTDSAVPLVFDPSMISGPDERFYLFHCMLLFFQNGGGDCFILSLGGYDGDDSVQRINADDFKKLGVFEKLTSTPGPSLILAPDFVSHRDSCYLLYQDMLKFCADTKSCFAILDVIPDDTDVDSAATIQHFRDAIGESNRSYGAAYYPWLNTSVVGQTQVSLANLDIYPTDLKKILPEQAALKALDEYNAVPGCDTATEQAIKLSELHNTLVQSSIVYKQIMETISSRLNLLPPGAAIAGIYTTVDLTLGPWKAPANVSIASVQSASVKITGRHQENMNVDPVAGKSVNAIREFEGRGIIVWGARTLDGNSNDWRYISVRRTLMMIEQSLILACKAWVFEPNDAGTWVKMKGMMQNFLTGLWRQGALQGSKPEEAFHVKLGLGESMTAADMQNGLLKAIVMIAMLRPGEFISFELVQHQQMQ